jgi:FAD binding domain/Berberine and berberine like
VACVDFASASGTPVAARNGGHSYGGYSTTSGLVIDVAGLGGVGPGKASGTARIGAGARLIDVYAGLDKRGVSVPGGSCPTVGITGSTLGGGIGVVGRKYGLSCDRLTAVELVTADGELVRADEFADADLLWAHRGGGGGNFGVVTALEFATHRVQELTHFVIRWNWSHAADVVAGWQGWLEQAPDELWSSLHLDGAGSASTAPQVYATGVFVGGTAATQRELDALIHAVPAAATERFVASDDYLDTMLIEGGCARIGLAGCHPGWVPASGGTLGRESNLARSDFIAAPLSPSGVEVVLAAIEDRRNRGLLGGAVVFDSYGGAINRMGAKDTAFVHRDALACLQYIAPAPPSGPATNDHAWLDATWTAMRPHVSGFAYQNYIDPALSDWQHAYYGGNLARLIDIKAAVDPRNVFGFAQGIPVAAPDGSARAAAGGG